MSAPFDPVRSGLRVATGMVLLPFRVAAFGLRSMTRTATGLGRLAAGRASPVTAEAASVASRRPASPVNVPDAAGWSAAVRPLSSLEPPTAVDVPVDRPETHETSNETMEEDPMSTCCNDKDVSGCELKIIQYTIVDADPNPGMKDSERIIEGPKVIATSDDLTDSSFTAWVIALYMENHRVPPEKTQFLRVCYTVTCRIELPCVNYEQQQAVQLSNLVKTLQACCEDKVALAPTGKAK